MIREDECARQTVGDVFQQIVQGLAIGIARAIFMIVAFLFAVGFVVQCVRITVWLTHVF